MSHNPRSAWQVVIAPPARFHTVDGQFDNALEDYPTTGEDVNDNVNKR